MTVITESRRPRRTRYCRDPNGKEGETICVDGVLARCTKGRWRPTKEYCFSSKTSAAVTLVEKASSCLQTNFDCQSSTNVISTANSVSTGDCDQYCKNTINGCNNWTFLRRESLCFALTDCNNGVRRNGFVSGTPGCVPEDTAEVEKDGQVLLAKDCLQQDTGCKKLTNHTIKVGSAHECAQICEINFFCRFFTYNPATKECNLFYSRCPETTTETGLISGDQDCASYRESFGADSSCSLKCAAKVASAIFQCALKYNPFKETTQFIKCVFEKLTESGCKECACSKICKKYPSICGALPCSA